MAFLLAVLLVLGICSRFAIARLPSIRMRTASFNLVVLEINAHRARGLILQRREV